MKNLRQSIKQNINVKNKLAYLAVRNLSKKNIQRYKSWGYRE